jgi:predicted RecA/RadA family phage recombinase
MGLMTKFESDGNSIDYTAGSALVAGQPIAVAGRCGILEADLASGQKGSVRVKGNVKVRQSAIIQAAGAKVYWDNDADPVNGTAGSGAAAATGDILMGSVAEASVAADEWVLVALNEFTNADVLATE